MVDAGEKPGGTSPAVYYTNKGGRGCVALMAASIMARMLLQEEPESGTGMLSHITFSCLTPALCSCGCTLAHL